MLEELYPHPADPGARAVAEGALASSWRSPFARPALMDGLWG